MRVLISSTKFSGHLNPMLPYAKAMQNSGHEVLVAVPEAAADVISRNGLKLQSVAEPSDEDVKAAWARLDKARGKDETGVAAAGAFLQRAEAAFPGLQAIIDEWRPDLILRESLELGALVAAEEAGVPTCRVGVHCGQGEMDWFGYLTEPLDGFRGRAGLPADDGASIRAEPVYSAFPDFMDEGVDWRGTRPPFRIQPTQPRSTRPPTDKPQWASQDGKAFVYFTFGTVSGRSEKSRAAYRSVLEALSTLPVSALLTTGPVMPREELGTVPSNVTVESYVPQADILPFADAVVCHGGSGTLLAALSQAVPMVVVPLFADQPLNAASVERVGSGISVTNPTADEIHASLDRVLSDDAFQRVAKDLADRIARMPGIDAAVGLMETLAESGD